MHQYVEQGDLAHRLALKTKECESLRIVLKHQCDENITLQAMVNMYKEKEVVAAATPIAPLPGFKPIASPRQREAVLALLQTLNIELPTPAREEEQTITTRPRRPMPRDPDWSEMSEETDEQKAACHERALV